MADEVTPMYYVVEKSRDGSRRVYRSGQLVAYAERQLKHGYKTLAAARKVADRLSTDIALDIYSHRALEGERYYEENYKEYEIENTKERALQMSVREFLNCCTMNWHGIAIYEDLEDCYDEKYLAGRYKDMREIPDKLLKCTVNTWATDESTDIEGNRLTYILIGI